MPQHRQGFTTMVDIDEFKRTTWSYLVNVKMTWEYDGIAWIMRQANIPLYGKDQGTMKMNHPVMGAVIPSHKDKNYGVSLYVPSGCKKKAQKLIADWDHVRACAELEASEGKAYRDAFERQALEAKRARSERARQRRRERAASIFAPFRQKTLAK